MSADRHCHDALASELRQLWSIFAAVKVSRGCLATRPTAVAKWRGSQALCGMGPVHKHHPNQTPTSTIDLNPSPTPNPSLNPNPNRNPIPHLNPDYNLH